MTAVHTRRHAGNALLHIAIEILLLKLCVQQFGFMSMMLHWIFCSCACWKTFPSSCLSVVIWLKCCCKFSRAATVSADFANVRENSTLSCQAGCEHRALAELPKAKH